MKKKIAVKDKAEGAEERDKVVAEETIDEPKRARTVLSGKGGKYERIPNIKP